jgi:hypothetical protein
VGHRVKMVETSPITDIAVENGVLVEKEIHADLEDGRIAEKSGGKQVWRQAVGRGTQDSNPSEWVVMSLESNCIHHFAAQSNWVTIGPTKKCTTVFFGQRHFGRGEAREAPNAR